MRVEQPLGTRGSQKWLQLAIDRAPNVLQELILPSLPGATSVVWRSPLRTDGYAEYRDASFLKLIGQEALSTELGSFWPSKGPQWDALGVSDAGHVLLVEAKAHIPELFSPKTGATNASRARIQAAFGTVAKALGAEPKADWSECFYQYANRVAHLWFLRNKGVDAKLVLLGFLNDKDIHGPSSAEAWHAAYTVVDYVLGLPNLHPLCEHILHVELDSKPLIPSVA